MTPAPPRLAVRVLAWALRKDAAGPAILGDLHEDFTRQLRRRGASAARVWYWKEALHLLLVRASSERRSAPVPTPRSRRTSPAAALPPLVQDGAYALRVLARAPAFSLLTACTVALGVGAATTVFSVLQPLMISPLPFADPGTLVWIQNQGEPGDGSLSAVTSRTANLHDFRLRSRSFEGLTGYHAFFDQRSYALTGVGEPERLVGVGVAHDFLDVLGVKPQVGRTFTVEEGLVDGPPAVLLSHGFWIRRFAGDPGVVGRALTLNELPHIVVGVLPAAFDFSSIFTPGTAVDFLIPFPVLTAEQGGFQGNVLFMIGRLRPGVGVAAAQAELDGVIRSMQEQDPERWGLGAAVAPLSEHVAGPYRPALLLLAAAAGTLMLLVCVNVSNLFLARGPSRARELAVRKALGASRARLVRQLVFETLAISVVGAALGSALAAGATRWVSRATIRIPLLDGVRVDGPALLFAIAAAVAAGLLVAVLPALQVGEGGESAALRSAVRGVSASRGARRLKETLVFAQVTLACGLLVVGGLLVRSFRSVTAVDLGFDPEGTVAWATNASQTFPTLQERADFYAALSDRVAAAAGVEEAGLIDGLPLGRNRTWGFSVPGLPEEQDTDDEIFPRVIDPGYVPAMRIEVLAGRNISRDDTSDAPRVVLMNESGARRAFGTADAVGRSIGIWTPEDWEVVGIVADVRDVSPEMEAGIQVYFPIAQMPDYATLDLVVRSDLPTDAVVESVSSVLGEIDPSMPTAEYWTVQATVDRALSTRRFTLGVLSAFGVAALLLAGLGIYGVLAQSVAERRSEIGIRMALGASGAGIVGALLRQTLLLAGAGIVAGGGLALAAGRLFASLLFGVRLADPVSFAGMTLTLMVVAAAACAIPALRAARTPSLGALRGD